MRWRWRRRPVPEDPEPPRGIILRYRGRAIPCTPLRDPDLDEHGCAAWLAVPDEPVTIAPDAYFELVATVPLPDNCVVSAGFATPSTADDEDAWPGSR